MVLHVSKTQKKKAGKSTKEVSDDKCREGQKSKGNEKAIRGCEAKGFIGPGEVGVGLNGFWVGGHGHKGQDGDDAQELDKRHDDDNDCKAC